MRVEFTMRGTPVTQPTFQQLLYVPPYGSADTSLMGRTLTVTSILESSKVITTPAFGFDRAPASVI